MAFLCCRFAFWNFLLIGAFVIHVALSQISSFFSFRCCSKHSLGFSLLCLWSLARTETAFSINGQHGVPALAVQHRNATKTGIHILNAKLTNSQQNTEVEAYRSLLLDTADFADRHRKRFLVGMPAQRAVMATVVHMADISNHLQNAIISCIEQ